MNAIFRFIEKSLMGPMTKLSEQRHLRAIRDGVVATVPLILVGSFFLIVAFLQLQLPKGTPLQEFLAKHAGTILIPYRMTMFIMTIYAVIGIGSSLARSYKYDALSGSIIAVVAFLMTIVPTNLGTLIPPEIAEAAAAATTNGVVAADFQWVANIQALGWVIPSASLGSAGMFVGILAALGGVEVMHFCKHFKLTVKMPESVPVAVSRSFEALIPIGIVMIVLFVVRDVLNFDIQNFIMTIFKPVVYASGTLPGALAIVLLITLLWACGIHGVSIVGSVARPLWLILLNANMEAMANGTALPNIAPEPFYQWFIWVGGSGATLGLCILMCFSASEYLKRLGRASIVPGICNINEPIIYGAPIMLNPFLAIPFVLGPIITTIISYGAMYFGIVARPFAQPPWTLPAPIGAWLSTGDWKAAILCIINIAICMAIYYPFFKAYEKKLMIDEKAASIDAAAATA